MMASLQRQGTNNSGSSCLPSAFCWTHPWVLFQSASSASVEVSNMKMPQYGATRLLAVVVACLACSISQPASAASSQAGFISIDCGSSFAYTDQVTGINWVPDTNFTSLGTNVVNVPGSAKWSNNSELTTLRTFTEPTRAKYCYQLPGVTPNATYLIRHTYWYGSYDGAPTTPIFYVYIDAALASEIDVSNTEDIINYHQHTYKALADTISFCLMRHPLSGADPFISSLELRPLLAGAYEYSALDSGLLLSVHRNYGGYQVIRFPEDEYDRIWKPVAEAALVNVTSEQLIGNVNELPQRIPSAVLQTGQTSTTVRQVNISFLLPRTEPLPAILELCFAELNESSTSRTFTIDVEGSGPVVENTVIKTGGALQAHVVAFQNWSYRGSESIISLTPTAEATSAPLLNAMSLHFSLDTKQALTYGPDVAGLEQVKLAWNLTSWNGDPCLPAPHAWILCSSIESLPRIISVNLSGYNLIGEIPAAINKMTALLTLVLDNNAFTGPIPELSLLTSLQKLHLQNNKLSGPIPASLGLITTLQELYLQNNNFTGSVPTVLKRDGLTLDVSGNPSLLENTAMAGPVPSPSPVESGLGSGSSSNKSDVGLFAGVAGGSVAGVLVLGCFCLVCFKWSNNRYKQSKLSSSDPVSHGSSTGTKSSSPATAGLHSPNNMEKKKPVMMNQGALVYTLHDVHVATNNYSRKLGQGGFGSVYYGKLPNGFEVAVKVCDPEALPDAVEFNIEVEVLSRVHHRNLVNLVGYCKENNSQILVYEFLHNGTVQEHLYGSEKAIKHPLDWTSRLYIALDAAQGLEYLHTGCTPSMIHRDIKSCNILLSDQYVAKVADFGLCKFGPADGETHVSTVAKGTFGYLDPEYFETHMLTDKSDVYSFGVFLLELISARKPIDNFVGTGPCSHIAIWAREMMNMGDVETLVGSGIATSNADMSSVWKVAELAMRCVEKEPKFRPCMNDVVRELREAIAIEDAHLSYGSSSVGLLYDGQDHPQARLKFPQNSRFSGAARSGPSKIGTQMLRQQAR